ncbi:PREDICTED: uncharacterized protein LOC104700157 [Camelina sativa]|uniref:Uncharacterized protein LOC104700157 n=1 Tax=Camelina sativa TaxID=90675 RepID=A0ABM1Q879_CAMSA|nr:PREDICTED: uncharacterized protein LOC104700157 [Camelina sativa]
MAGVGPITQDWEPVVIRKKAPNSAAKRDEKTVNAARRSGADIETVRKFNAGTNKAASSGTSLNTKRLDDDTENLTLYETCRLGTHLPQSLGNQMGGMGGITHCFWDNTLLLGSQRLFSVFVEWVECVSSYLKSLSKALKGLKLALHKPERRLRESLYGSVHSMSIS